ncbi:hydrolase, alpha/beta fold family, putative [Synechococcus sp. PCC 7335]|uniref:alpha/beta fold hydrolase n=1 Tax=Synechococcus sp. (strain ATCC 29403 / PCC 7335) TaxID=91464 RepID=UPI00017ECB6D|nr:alpha/beta hydrolase [Synechococcus sp. PCC 7335]EDX83107.1 hydrolase, alpha/beta fold family, putative [Synechococcus sp. PCC 7335]
MTESWHHDYLDTNGIKLHYVTQGEGPLMLMLHGFPAFWYSWKYQIPEFAQHYKVVALDLRGYNNSDRPKQTSAYRLEALVADIRGAIAALGYDRCILVGHDWGGALAWSVSYAHPQLIEKLVVMNFPHPAKFAAGLRTPQQLLKSAYILFFQLPLLPEILLSANNYEGIAATFSDINQYNPEFTTSDINRFREAAARKGAIKAMLNYYRNLFQGPIFKNQWGQLNVPTCMIWGEDDQAFSKELTYDTDAYVKDLQLHYVSQAAHWVQLDRPDVVNQHVRQYLGYG